jgi:type I restriction enzyme R subunit
MSPPHPTEKKFEEHIEQHLLNSGYHKERPENYNKDLCLIPSELIGFIQTTQPEQWQKLEKQLKADTARQLWDRVKKEIDSKGTLEVLRKGIQTRGCKFKLAYFQPANKLNPDHLKLYQQNRFRIVRQLQYSKQITNSLDLAIFLNGIPILTAELKNSLTGQFVEDAIEQYKQDRDPTEPLFRFQRCLVHFAVGNEKAYMTTRLAKEHTYFLPFNKDTENPVNANGFRTHYIWEDIWQTDTLLNLIQNYLHLQTTTEKVWTEAGKLEEKTQENLIFPRFHQLDAVRKLLQAVKQEGAGNRYLIQHSAGSGKSNSIAWLAHQLANLYQKETDSDRLFDSIIVVTDRKVLDRQLQNTIKQFEQTAGVVVPIDEDSAQLRQAIETGKAIIITTLQKFSVISNSTASQKGKRFAIIIDEAHSSQSGESAKQLNQTLSAKLEDAETADIEEEETLEDKIAQEIQARSRIQKHISYFAFTATPKNKTLQTFGRPNTDGINLAFHVYSMRQAIEEGFILDVLQNYTTYKRYFKLHQKYEPKEEFEKRKAARLLIDYVDLQPHAIEMKLRIILDHFLTHVADKLNGKSRAMICTRSRLHAVRYFQVLSRLMAEVNLPYKPMIAFSGTVNDPDVEAKYTENSLNQLEGRTDIPDALKTPKYRILVVADKYQTGFDEPLLYAMYVDKKLGGVSAVQTLSRLNRTMRGKDECVVLDFVNETENIQTAFQDYYQTTLLDEVPDPDRLYDQKDDILRDEIFIEQDVDDLAEILWNQPNKLELLQPILDRIRDQWRQQEQSQREEFRSKLQQFIRLYGFLAQVITFADIDLEKFYTFVRLLNRKLDPRESGKLPKEVLDAVKLDSLRIEHTASTSIALLQQDTTLEGIGDGSSSLPQDDDKDTLTNIVNRLNQTYGANLTEQDKIDLETIRQEVEQNDELRAVMSANNTEHTKREKFNETIDKILLKFIHNKLELYRKIKTPEVEARLKQDWFDLFRQDLAS